MKGRKLLLLPCSILHSAINGLLSLFPFLLFWLVVRILLTSEASISETPIWSYAVVAFVVSAINILLYFVALMLSHLTAFRIENNMCRSVMKCLMHAPLGLFEIKYLEMHKIIDEDSGETHTFVAHILPDVASTIVAPLGVIILLFAVD